ncbi:hypothetical protein BN1723_017506 [Verticillium longisporum]|uniref:Uncharacterized protein n=1 Tax=Verticillium longisporum TaxID=100787 RepID=A0A0G4L5L3_VERLO|nr:hypothetical protein BN1723_017506 [Verticillium longisporum]
MDGISAKPCMRHLTNQAFELGSAVTWMQESAVDISMLALILLVACRSLAKLQHSNVYDPIALRYKVQCLHHLNLALSHEGSDISDMTITKTLVLASEEVFSGNKAAADQHLQAAVHMINLRRNPATVNIWNHDENMSLWSQWDNVTARESVMNVERTSA